MDELVNFYFTITKNISQGFFIEIFGNEGKKLLQHYEIHHNYNLYSFIHEMNEKQQKITEDKIEERLNNCGMIYNRNYLRKASFLIQLINLKMPIDNILEKLNLGDSQKQNVRKIWFDYKNCARFLGAVDNHICGEIGKWSIENISDDELAEKMGNVLVPRFDRHIPIPVSYKPIQTTSQNRIRKLDELKSILNQN